MLQYLNYMPLIADHFVFSLIPVNDIGAIVFSWLGQSDAAERFIQSLHRIPNGKLSHTIVRFAFESFEDVFAAPKWWENLDNIAQENLLRRQLAGTPLYPNRPDYLRDDGLRLVQWEIISCQTNIAGLISR